MSRTGLRPQCWKIQGEIPHQQHTAWHRQRAQAIFRGEHWDLPFEQFQQVWDGKWSQRGRGRDQYCMTRVDFTLGWTLANVQLIRRLDHLRQHQQRQRSGFYESLKNPGE